MSSKCINLNSKQKKWFQELEELWNYYDSQINASKLKTNDLRLVLLLHLTGGCHRLIRGFIAQLNGGSNDGLEGLLRCLVEATININYIFADKTDNRARAFIINGIRSRLTMIRRILKLMKMNAAPAMSEVADVQHYEKIEKGLQSELIDAEKSFGKENIIWPKIETRAQKGNSEELYATAFGLFSEDSHMSAEGMNRHLVQRDNLVVFNTSVDFDRLDHQIQTAYTSYIAFLNTCSVKLGFPAGKGLERFNKSEMLPRQTS